MVENCLGVVLFSAVVPVAVPDVGVNVLVLTIVFRGCVVAGVIDSLVVLMLEIDDFVSLAVVSLIVGRMIAWVVETVVEEETNVVSVVVYLSAVCCERVVVSEVFVCLSVVNPLINVEDFFVYSGVLVKVLFSLGDVIVSVLVSDVGAVLIVGMLFVSIPADDVDDVDDVVDAVNNDVLAGVPLDFKICVTLWVDVVVTLAVAGGSDSEVKVLLAVLRVIVDELLLCFDDSCEVITTGLLVLVIVGVVVVKDWFGV